MKRSIALLISIILLIAIVSTVMAEHVCSWYRVSTTKKLDSTSTGIVPKCNHKPYYQLEKTCNYWVTTISVCSGGCGAVKTVTYKTSEVECLY